MITVQPAFPKRVKGVLPSEQELTEILYVRVRSDLEVCRALDFMKDEAIAEVLRDHRPILMELSTERVDAIKRIVCGLAQCIWERVVPEPEARL